MELQDTLDISKIDEIFTKKVVFNKVMKHIIKQEKNLMKKRLIMESITGHSLEERIDYVKGISTTFKYSIYRLLQQAYETFNT